MVYSFTQGVEKFVNTSASEHFQNIISSFSNVNFWEDLAGAVGTMAFGGAFTKSGSVPVGEAASAGTGEKVFWSGAADEAIPIGVRNGHLAGQVHPASGVPFDNAGFPDFSNYLYKGGANDVIIEPTGNRATYFISANKSSGYSSTPKGYTWHHHQTAGRMQLVETNVHSQTGHTGGFSLW